jgi:4-carboxymuconolactone decarboxylase
MPTLPRIPLPSPETMTPEQRRVYDAVVSGPRGSLRGPLRAALHRPELADKWQQLGELLRYRTSLPARLSELAILVTARHCRCALEWHIHEDMAVKANLERAIIEDIRAGRRPVSADADALAIYDYAEELTRQTHVRSEVYQRVLERWQPVGVVELTALIGYYTMVAMTLNAHEIPLPDGAPTPFEPVPA